MNRLIALILMGGFICGAGPSVAETMKPGEMWTFGIGRKSCARWTSDRETEINAYIFGYWSGINKMAADLKGDSSIGYRTDSAAVIEEVRLECRSNPSMLLKDAIDVVYVKIRQQEWHTDHRD